MVKLVYLDPDCHLGPDANRVLSLFQEARDYVLLESSKEPDIAYLRETFDGPPSHSKTDRFVIGVEDSSGSLLGTAGYIRNFYSDREWYIGLLILNPAARNQGIGTKVVQKIVEHARREGGSRLRIAVLDKNKKARRFWERQDFSLERTVPGDPAGDNHVRHVLKRELGDENAP